MTGGATGIGAAISARLADDGLNVLAVQRTESEAQQGREAFRSHPATDRMRVSGHDLSTGAGCASAVADCLQRFGGLEVLVNNAGVTGAPAVGPIENCDDRQIDAVIDTNLKAPLRLAREAVESLKAGQGIIVNISSAAELLAQAEGPAYVASKAGLGGLTRALAYDLGPMGVRVVSIAPGDVATATSRSPTLASKRSHISLGKKTPLGYSADPADVANVVAWVISDEARFVTGCTIAVDGGLTAY